MNKIWYSSYPTGVPENINPEKYASLVSMFEDSVRRHADRPAYINMGKVMTYRRLEVLSRAFAAYLQNDLKLKKGDRVAIMMPNLLQYPVALFGILRAGMIAVNVNPLYTPRELEHQLNDAGVKAVVIVSNFAHTLEKIVRNTAVKHVILSGLGDMFSPAKRTVFNFVVKYIKKLIPKYDLPNAISFRSALSMGKTTEYIRSNIHVHDIAILQYTGGTTGLAKGAMLTHRNLLANIEQIRAAYAPVINGEQELVVTALPLYHIFALSLNCLLLVELGGTNLLITNPRDIGGMIKEMSRYPFTILTGVNTLFNALLNHEDFKELDFSNLHLTVGGGMSVHRSVAERWHKVTGTHLLEGYGLTECSPIVAANPYTEETYTASIGIPFPSTDVKLVDSQMNEVPLGEAGELLVSGPQVMKGYWQRPEATKEAITEEGWLCTGDIATMDERGFLRIVDRKKDMIIVSGFNVYPNEIEDVLALHPKISESAVIGIPDEQTGEVVKACIVKKDPSLTRDDVVKHCRKHLTAYKVPKSIEFFDELPKSNVGKILRKDLKVNAEKSSAS